MSQPFPSKAKADEAGFYEVHVGGGGARSLVFAANPLPRESDLTPLDVNAFIDSIAIEDAAEDKVRADGARSPETTIEQRVWWFLLLACAMLLGLDTLLSNRLSRSVQAS